jgi:hypothetical protein
MDGSGKEDIGEPLGRRRGGAAICFARRHWLKSVPEVV